MSLVFSAIFRGDQRVARPGSLSESLDSEGPADGGDSANLALALDSPTATELAQISDRYDLPPGVLADALREHPRVQLETYDDVLAVVLRPATYIDADERVEFGEVQAFVGPHLFLGITRGRTEDTELLSASLHEAERQHRPLACGPLALLYGLFEAVTDSYLPVVRGLEEDIDQIEEELFAGHPGVSRRIYELFNEVIDFQRATRPFRDLLDDVERATESQLGPTTGDGNDPRAALHRRLRRVKERVARVVERSDTFRAQLQNALGVNQALVAQKQNEDMKRISGWAAILFAPTLVGAIYGMNFAVMPELDWRLGYPYALGLMVVLTVGFYTVFKIKKWF